jgi:hypothetical protein
MPSDPTRRLLLGALAAAPVAPLAGRALAAGVQTLRVGDALPRFDRLKPGVRTYLRSRQIGEQHAPVDIWRRETRIEIIDGVSRLRIVQRWDSPTSVAERDSVFELGTFRPLTHLRVSTRDGTRVVEGFRFSNSGITGLDGVTDNSRADFSVASDEPMYNFETDLEMLQTLPLDAGYAVSIPFYHPAGGPPARYVWRVAAEDRLQGPDGADIDCWIVETDYNSPANPPARFWLAKTTQQFIKLESLAPDGVIHRKTLLS